MSIYSFFFFFLELCLGDFTIFTTLLMEAALCRSSSFSKVALDPSVLFNNFPFPLFFNHQVSFQLSSMASMVSELLAHILWDLCYLTVFSTPLTPVMLPWLCRWPQWCVLSWASEILPWLPIIRTLFSLNFSRPFIWSFFEACHHQAFSTLDSSNSNSKIQLSDYISSLQHSLMRTRTSLTSATLLVPSLLVPSLLPGFQSSPASMVFPTPHSSLPAIWY